MHDTLQLTIGTKFEYNDFSGSGSRPIARLAWSFDFGLRSSLDWNGFQVDMHCRHHSAIASLPETPLGEGIDSCSETNVPVARRISEHMEIALAGYNLFHDEHEEFGPPAAPGAVERSIYGRVVWQF